MIPKAYQNDILRGYFGEKGPNPHTCGQYNEGRDAETGRYRYVF